MTNRLITPQLMEALKKYPLYSQESKGGEAVCVAVFQIGRIRWYILEGQQEGDDFVLFAVVCGERKILSLWCEFGKVKCYVRAILLVNHYRPALFFGNADNLVLYIVHIVKGLCRRVL